MAISSFMGRLHWRINWCCLIFYLRYSRQYRVPETRLRFAMEEPNLTQAEPVSTNRLRILQFVYVGTQYWLSMVAVNSFPSSEKQVYSNRIIMRKWSMQKWDYTLSQQQHIVINNPPNYFSITSNCVVLSINILPFELIRYLMKFMLSHDIVYFWYIQ